MWTRSKALLFTNRRLPNSRLRGVSLPFQLYALKLKLRISVLPSCNCKRLDFLAKLTYGFTICEMPLMPRGIILWGSAHHHDKPFGVKIPEMVNQNIKTFSSKLIVCNHCHDSPSIMNSTGFAIRIFPSECNFLVIPLSVVKNQSHEAASAHAICIASIAFMPYRSISSPRQINTSSTETISAALDFHGVIMSGSWKFGLCPSS